MVNSVIGGINSAIDLANKLPGPDIPTIAKIPKLAKGGIAMPSVGGTLAIVAEAGRPERIEPLDSNGLSKRDHAILNVIANGGGGGTPNVNVYLGTGQLVPLIAEVVEEREDRLADRVLTGTKAG
jgi:phage-related protein